MYVCVYLPFLNGTIWNWWSSKRKWLIFNYCLRMYSVEAPFLTLCNILEKCLNFLLFSVMIMFSIILVHFRALKSPVQSKWKLQVHTQFRVPLPFSTPTFPLSYEIISDVKYVCFVCTHFTKATANKHHSYSHMRWTNNNLFVIQQSSLTISKNIISSSSVNYHAKWPSSFTEELRKLCCINLI